jgi:ribonuclease P protein component
VTRNTVKRRLRAAIRQWLPELASGVDAVLVAHGKAAQATYEELVQATGHAFRQAQLIAASGEDVGR